jgi:hypothetical protein
MLCREAVGEWGVETVGGYGRFVALEGRPERVNASGQHEYTAALRVISETLRLGELTLALGQPTTSHDIGDPVGRGGGERKHAYWGRESRIERTRPLNEHVELLLTFAEARRGSLAELRERGCRIDVFCGVFSESTAQGGWVFEPELSRRLAELGLPVSFDLY